MGRKVKRAGGRLPIAFDCFSGCGGMTQGFKKAGFKVIGAVDSDPDACTVYSDNHPEVRIWRRDVQNVGVPAIIRALNLKVGELDLLGGCPPCQGFSSLRTLNGNRRIRDKQNDLIFEFQRLVLGLKPKLVMLENVPGLHNDRRFEDFKCALEAVGYIVRAKILNVVHYGVPQRRRRLVLLASRVGPVRFARRSNRRRTVRDAIGSLPKPGKSGDGVHDLPENRSDHVKKIIAAVPRNGGSRTSLPKSLMLRCHKRSDGFRDVYGRMRWDEPAPTITTGCFNPSKGRFLHPTANRTITIREAALLQSFPAKYKFSVNFGKVQIAMMVGNALPPEFIRRHALTLRTRMLSLKKGARGD